MKNKTHQKETHIMKNINKLIQNTDLSLEMQTNLYYSIEKVSEEIEAYYEHYEECKKSFMAADAKLNKAIADDDYDAQFEAEHEIIPILNDLRETSERLKQLAITKQSFYKTLMDHQKRDEHNQKSDEHNIYVLPRQQAFELLKALTEGIKANTDFETVVLNIDPSFLQK
jgi:flagellar motility protein MotE (MotC chaperone)